MFKHKVRMLSTQKGVHDGELHPVPFYEGEEYEIGSDLLQAFVNCGAVELVDLDEPEVAAETEVGQDSEPETEDSDKAKGDAPANKAKKAAPENKAKK